MTSTKTGCQVVDQIIEWTDKDGRLNVGVGDLVLDDGQFKQIGHIYWRREFSTRVVVRYEGPYQQTHPKPAGELVAVRRYIETEDPR